MNRRLSILALLTLAACGGGGSESPAAAPSVQPATYCSPAKPVRVQLFGDSTTLMQGNNLQVLMDARFGAGAIVVENLGANGATSADFPAAKVQAGAITVASYGINDIRQPGASVEAFKAQMRVISPTVFQTPNPPIDGYAQAVRDVAAEQGKPVADVSAAVRAMPNWRALIADGVHPADHLYPVIAADVLMPVLVPEVRRALCQ